MWPSDDPVSGSHSIGPTQVAFFGDDFEFVGPSAMLIPEETMKVNDVSKPLIKDGAWVQSAILVPATKWAALVDGHRRSCQAGTSPSKNMSVQVLRFHLDLPL